MLSQGMMSTGSCTSGSLCGTSSVGDTTSSYGGLSDCGGGPDVEGAHHRAVFHGGGAVGGGAVGGGGGGGHWSWGTSHGGTVLDML